MSDALPVEQARDHVDRHRHHDGPEYVGHVRVVQDRPADRPRGGRGVGDLIGHAEVVAETAAKPAGRNKLKKKNWKDKM